jgi:hypothetical protein
MVNLLKPTGYGVHQQVAYFNNCTLCPHCINVFCVCLKTKKLIGFYNRDESVYSAVRTGPLNEAVCAPYFKGSTEHLVVSFVKRPTNAQGSSRCFINTF